MADPELTVPSMADPEHAHPESPAPTSATRQSPHLFLYSLLVPILWFSVGGLFQYFAPNAKLGATGLALIVFTAVWITCWHFTGTFKRQFLAAERIKLIALTTTWAVLSESLALWAIVDDRALAGEPALGTNVVVGILVFTFLFDAIIMWASYTFVAKRAITKLLASTNRGAGA